MNINSENIRESSLNIEFGGGEPDNVIFLTRGSEHRFRLITARGWGKMPKIKINKKSEIRLFGG